VPNVDALAGPEPVARKLTRELLCRGGDLGAQLSTGIDDHRSTELCELWRCQAGDKERDVSMILIISQ